MAPTPLSVKSISVTPNPAVIDAPLTVKVDFQTNSELKNVCWKASYIIDVGHKRHVIDVSFFID